jgi:hypothetical protein
MRYNNPKRRFWHSLLFRRITAGLIFLACFQANYIIFGKVVAIVDAVLMSIIGIIFYMGYNKLKYKNRNYKLR